MTPNPYVRPLHADVVLASGLVVRHRHMDNGAQEVYTDRSPDYMSEAEWTEYCTLIAPRPALSQVAKNWVAFYGQAEAKRRAYATTRKDRTEILATLRVLASR